MAASVFKINQTVAMGPLALVASVPVGEAYRVMHVTINYSAAPTTSEFLTIALDAHAGAVYDMLMYTLDPSATSATDIVWYPDGFEWILEGGDDCVVSFANTDHRTIGAQVTLKRVA